MGKWCLHASLFIFYLIIIKAAGNQDRHKSSDEFDLGRIRPLILELLALEWRNFHTSELEYLWSQLANLDQILCVASLGVGKGCIMFWGTLDQNSGVHGNRKPPLTYNGEDDVSTFSRLLAHLSRRLTRWAYNIPMVRRRRRRPSSFHPSSSTLSNLNIS